MSQKQNSQTLIEAILFIRGSEGIDLKNLSQLLKQSMTKTKKDLQEYEKKINSDKTRGFLVKQFGDIYKMITKRELFESLNSVVDIRQAKLTQAALETLTIIAYKQPISRTEVDRIRSVNSDYAIRKLVAHDLIEERGRADTPGMPILYGTTKHFLDKFNITKLENLPEFKSLVNFEEKDTTTSLFNFGNQEN